MRKRMFLPIVLSLCVLQTGAFAATARGNARGTSSAESGTGTQSTVARSATRNSVKNTNTASTQPVSARAASRQKVVSSGSAQTTTARAASTQKVINNGTKVSTAVANTVVAQDCQDAFYGCMDSFCMIDNASGGRCQCSERNAELLNVMDEIAKLDEQSYAMATEGVERIQMGADAEQIIANAKASGDKVINKSSNETKARQLKLEAWNDNVFSEAEDLLDDVEINTSAVSDALSKSGAELYNSAAKLCVGQMPTKCSGSLKVLQSIYAQKIKSDCVAFENSLKQQKVASTQKLQTAEKALRDAALEKFREENKYATTGECVQAYAQCMESECGNDYSKCITFAAEENIKGSTVKEKSRTIKGIVDIVLSGATMSQLASKKTICDGNVLKYCVNHQSEVWGKYLEYAAPILKSAEVISEDNLRQNCVKDLSTCFQSACAAEFDPNKDEASYDMCLSDPELVIDFCKVKLDACIVATGGKGATKDGVAGSRLWNGIKALLNAMRVDACTKEVKSGIEAICGEDFAYCVGLNPGTIASLLPIDSLTACMEKNNNNRNDVLQYIAEIAQGYALQINDKMYEICENAAKEAMIKVCGNADTCDALNLGNMSFDALLDVKLCMETQKDDKFKLTCKGINEFSDSTIVKGSVRPHIINRINVNNIVYQNKVSEKADPKCMDEEAFEKLTPDAKLQCYNFEYDMPTGVDYGIKNGNEFADPGSAEVKAVLSGLKNIFTNKMGVMLKDKTVYDCMHGKNVTGFEKTATTDRAKAQEIKETSRDYVFTNLLESYKEILVSKSLELLKEKYDKAEKDLQPKIDALNTELSERLSNIESAALEQIHKNNLQTCEEKAFDLNYQTNNRKCEDFDDNKRTSYMVGNKDMTKTEKEGQEPKYKICECKGYTGSGAGGKNEGFCAFGDGLFFETGAGRNYQISTLYWTTVKYEESTGTCTFTKMKYECETYRPPYCYNWDTTGEQVDQWSEKMPIIIDKQKLKNDGYGQNK